MIRRTLTWPTFFATFSPVAIVWPAGSGVMSASPASKARTSGAVADDWTQTNRGRSGPTRPSASSSSNALAMPTTPVPPPVG